MQAACRAITGTTPDSRRYRLRSSYFETTPINVSNGDDQMRTVVDTVKMFRERFIKKKRKKTNKN